MAGNPATDPWPAFRQAAAAGALADQPRVLFQAVARALGDVVGHRLFTILAADMEKRLNRRLYSSMPDAYAAGGSKPMRPNSWGDRPFGERRPYIGRTKDDIRNRFPDHALIESLDLGSVINLPVSFDGVFLGTVNLLHEEGYYHEDDAARAAPFAALLAPALMRYLASG
jgi:hypothetical protein